MRDWPSRDGLIDLMHRHHGVVADMAGELAAPEGSLRGHLKRVGLWGELLKARADAPPRPHHNEGVTHIDWPDDAKLLELLREHAGSLEAVSQVVGVSNSTVGRRLARHGLAEEVAKIRREVKANKPPPPVEEALQPSPEGPSEEAMLRERVRELETTLRKAHKITIIEERALRRMDEAIERVEQRYQPAKPKPVRPDGRHEFVLLFSDTHGGEVVSEEETLGMNFYDWDTMLTRMGKMQQSVLSYQAHRPYPVPVLHVAMLGDMLSGSIHEELARTNQFTDAEAIVQMAYDTAGWLQEFTPHFERITVTGVPGNHPRRSKKPTAKQAFNNDDWLLYKAVEMLLEKHDNFTFDFPRADFASVQVAQNWRALLMHGDGIRSSMPGVPWGGVVRRVTTLEQQFAAAKQPLDYVFMGHFHTRNMLDGVGVETVLNGSVKGLDEYSLKQFGSGRRPSQVLLTFHERKGLTDVSRIDLIDPVPAAAPALAA